MVGDIPALSTVYEEQYGTMPTKVPVHHVALGVGLVVGAVIVVGWLNHRANR